MSIEFIREKNKGLTIYEILDSEFRNFGNVIKNFDFQAGMKYMQDKTEIPMHKNVYIAADEELERIVEKEKIENEFYAQMPCQVGFCNGNNSRLNGLEYHKGSELLVAVTDLVLLLGDVRDIKMGVYDSKYLKGFYMSAGDVVELYGTTLHFAPCKVSEDGFKSIIILPKGTNLPLECKQEKNEIFAKNKWLYIHEDASDLKEKGAYVGIKGENVEVRPLESVAK